MSTYYALRSLPLKADYKSGDVFILFGELFGRGYVNGLLDQARQAGMTIVGITVGRRDRGNMTKLRPLTPDELAEAETNLGGKIINIPLEAGFDFDPSPKGTTPVDQLNHMSAVNWLHAEADMAQIQASREAGRERFLSNLERSVAEMDRVIPDGVNVHFAHTMAGGVPRAKLMMKAANRVFKGRGDRYTSSEAFWASDIGRLCALNFEFVTADTLQFLLDATRSIRERVQKSGKRVNYTAYGYHGCEAMIDGEMTWQTYTHYFQGEAKKKLEHIARQARQQGTAVTVFNCPEILTRSSDFSGVELSLYGLLNALETEVAARPILDKAASCLQDGASLKDFEEQVDAYLDHPTIRRFYDFEAWPMHNDPELMELMLGTSDRLYNMQKKEQKISDILSSEVLEATGLLIFNKIWHTTEPVIWLNHDVVMKAMLS